MYLHEDFSLMSSVQTETKIVPSNSSISTDSIGVAEILSFYKNAIKAPTSKIVFDIQRLSNFDGNMSALLLAVIHRLKTKHRKYVFVEIPSHINVLFRNGLVSHLSGNGNSNQYVDDRQSTIPLKSFDLNEDENFSNYLHNDFFGHRGVDNISVNTKRNLCSHFVEVFNNVQIHSNATDPLYTCGQYYPQQALLKFTMVDLGDGFLKKIKNKTNGEICSDDKAIEWALKNTNTTKDYSIYGPGGTGLKDLKAYCEANNGSLQIISGSNMMTFIKGKIVNNNLNTPFEGAIINLIFRGVNPN